MKRLPLTLTIFCALAIGASATQSKSAKQSPHSAGYLAFLIGTRAAIAPVFSYNLVPSALAAGFETFQVATKPLVRAPIVKSVAATRAVTVATTPSAVVTTSVPAITAASTSTPVAQALLVSTSSITSPGATTNDTRPPAPVVQPGGRPPRGTAPLVPPPINNQPIYSYP